MADTDEEQLDQVREWFRENGKALVAGAVIAIAGVVGWQQWGAHQERTAEAASIGYMQLVDARETGADPETVERRGRAVMDDYGQTVYGPMAALQLGEYHTDRDALDAAADSLRWVVDNADDDGFVHVARLRLAQVLMAMGEFDDALSALDVTDTGTYQSQYLERRGDAHAGLGENDRARDSYDQAMADDELSGNRRALLRLKRDDLVGEASAS